MGSSETPFSSHGFDKTSRRRDVFGDAYMSIVGPDGSATSAVPEGRVLAELLGDPEVTRGGAEVMVSPGGRDRTLAWRGVDPEHPAAIAATAIDRLSRIPAFDRLARTGVLCIPRTAESLHRLCAPA